MTLFPFAAPATPFTFLLARSAPLLYRAPGSFPTMGKGRATTAREGCRNAG